MPNNELSPPKISISLDYYLSLACRGLDEIATVSLELGLHIRDTIDPREEHAHVEFIGEGDKKLAQVYRIAAWRACAKRNEELRRKSEVDRQIRFAIEEERKITQLKIQRRRDILAEIIADVKKLYGPDVALKLTKGQPMTDLQRIEFFESLVFKALIGEHPKAASKFNITAEQIKEFSLLPRDPLFKNRYVVGGEKDDI